jgi:hypothetical protein
LICGVARGMTMTALMLLRLADSATPYRHPRKHTSPSATTTLLSDTGPISHLLKTCDPFSIFDMRQ